MAEDLARIRRIYMCGQGKSPYEAGCACKCVEELKSWVKVSGSP